MSRLATTMTPTKKKQIEINKLNTADSVTIDGVEEEDKNNTIALTSQ